jgi:hypothetical protein
MDLLEVILRSGRGRREEAGSENHGGDEGE